MGKTSELSDDLLVKILSYLPTKVAASTMILSKQWQFLWMWLPNLEFSGTFEYDSDSDLESDRKFYFERLRRFLLRNLPLYKAPVIESFCLKLYASGINPEDVKMCVLFAISRDVLELEISYSSDHGKGILPSSLYTSTSLVTLELNGGIFMDVPRVVSLPSLKTLRLEKVTYVNQDSLSWLLSNCPVLEDLSVSGFVDFGKMIIRVPSLQRLSLNRVDHLDEFVIDTPSLEYLELGFDYEHMYNSINMPKLKKAFVDVPISLLVKLIGSIPLVESLSICLSFDSISESKVVIDDVFVLNKLKHLKLYICEGHSSYVFVQLLKVSPNLRVLELFTTDGHGGYMEYWNQPSSVPECILSSLETFKWWGYQGRVDERELVIYILQNAAHLKTATFLLYKALDKPLDIIKELEFSHRASTTCQLLYQCSF